MILSRIALDTAKRPTMLALYNPSMFHGAVEQAFALRTGRRLWRVDTLQGERYLLLLSENAPDCTGIVRQFGTGKVPEMCDYTPLLERIEQGSRWQFRLRANPTYSKSRAEGRGSVHAHTSPEHQMRWLQEQGAAHGFSVVEDTAYSTQIRWYTFTKKAGSRVRLLGVTYEGLLTVTDAQAFREALINGIGRGKAYGMGLLTVMRSRGV